MDKLQEFMEKHGIEFVFCDDAKNSVSDKKKTGSKSILMSIRPEWVSKILNGEKTIEIRKTAPKCDLPIDVYIYCTKGRPLVFGSPLPYWVEEKYCQTINWNKEEANKCFESGDLCGKVVAKFTLKEVEYIFQAFVDHATSTLNPDDLYKKSCLKSDDIFTYFNGREGYAWYISDLQIFDEPKELSDFMKVGFNPDEIDDKADDILREYAMDLPFGPNVPALVFDEEAEKRNIVDELSKKYIIRRAPQSWCYVEELR